MEYMYILFLLFSLTCTINIVFKLKPFYSFRQFFFVTVIILSSAIVWDSVAVSRGHWTFNDDILTGIEIGLLPLEEYIFFLVVPYFVLTVYNLSLKIFDNGKHN